jgi:hypothetical protein
MMGRKNIKMATECLRNISVLKTEVLWVVAPCCLVEVHRHFIGACCLHQQSDKSTSEMSTNSYQITRRNKPEDSHVHACHREKLKSHSWISAASVVFREHAVRVCRRSCRTRTAFSSVWTNCTGHGATRDETLHGLQSLACSHATAK